MNLVNLVNLVNPMNPAPQPHLSLYRPHLRLVSALMLATTLAACGGGDDPAPGPTPAPAPSPAPSPVPSPAPSPAPANPDLATCPNFSPGFTSDTAYLQCMAGTYTGTTVSGAPCTLSFDGPGKGFRYETAGIDFSAPDAAFDNSIYGKSPGTADQLEAIVNYKIIAGMSPINYQLHFSFLFGQIKTKTITVRQGNQGPTSSCRIEL